MSVFAQLASSIQEYNAQVSNRLTWKPHNDLAFG